MKYSMNRVLYWASIFNGVVFYYKPKNVYVARYINVDEAFNNSDYELIIDYRQ